MKFYKKLILSLVTVASIAFTSCVDNNDYSLPNVIGNEENKALNAVLDSINNGQLTLRTISQVKQDWFTSREAKLVDQDIVVKGYVTSSDASGNFFREFYMQDAVENATAGIKVVLNQTNSHNQFNVGREVYIRLKGLYIGETRSGDNDVTIGGFVEDGGTELEAISESQIKQFNHILRSNTSEEIIPLPVKFSNIGDQYLGMLVKVDNVFFDESLTGKTYFDPTRDFDTDRLMKSCEGFDFGEFTLSTSSFANFGGALLPTGGGSIKAIVTKNYSRNLRLALNSVEDVDMNGDRCSLLDINDFEAVFEEDFQDAVDNTDLDFTGWVNFAEEGSELWTEQAFRGNGYTEFSGYRTNDDSNIGWLITPGIDMDAKDNEFLSFKAAQHHVDNSNENTLEVFVSTDFDGTDVAAATWVKVEANLPTKDSRWYQFQDSGLVDLSTYSGTLYVAFKSVASGNNSALDGSYMIDDVRVLAEK